MRVALAYDRVNKWGGAESVLLTLHEIWPDAPLFTSVYDEKLAPWAKAFDVRTSFLQKLPLPKNKHEYYPFLMGLAFESFNFDEYDLVISVTSEFAKAIITKPQTFHLCYCLTPTSYLWSGYEQYFSGKSSLFRALSQPVIKYLKFYDQIISHRPDSYVAISKTVQERIKRYYRQNSEIVFPPVNIHNPHSPHNSHNSDESYYLVVCRLVPNKRVDLVIKAFNKLDLALKIVGTGRQERQLKTIAKANIEFLGNLTDPELDGYYRNCKALIVPGEEDFGIVAVEAQSYGKPVIAFAKGGASETVAEGKTGWLFKEQTVSALARTVATVARKKIDPENCITNAKKFSKAVFLSEFKRTVELQYQYFLKNVQLS